MCIKQHVTIDRTEDAIERMYVFSLPSTPVARPSAIIFRGSKFYKTWRGTLRTPLFFFFCFPVWENICARRRCARVQLYEIIPENEWDCSVNEATVCRWICWPTVYDLRPHMKATDARKNRVLSCNGVYLERTWVPAQSACAVAKTAPKKVRKSRNPTQNKDALFAAIPFRRK